MAAPILAAAAVAADLTTMRSDLSSAGRPKLGLGLAALGRPGYINLGHGADMPDDRSEEAMRSNAHRVCDVAAALGIWYYDCARSYGLSEQFVSSWLATRDSEAALTVASKWGYEYTANWRVQVGDGEAHEVKEHSAAQFAKQHRETRALLPELNLYQIHSATEASGVLTNAEVLDALVALRDGRADGADGRRCAVGLSVSHPQVPTIERAIALERDGAPVFGAVQATFNLMDQSAGDALRAAHEAGMFVVIKEALANGRLTARAAPSPGLEVLRAEAAALGTSMDALALAWVMSHEWVDMCLSGASTEEQLRSNAEAIKLTPLEEGLHRRLGEALAQEVESYWADRRALQWN